MRRLLALCFWVGCGLFLHHVYSGLSVQVPVFNGDQAYELLEKQCDFGPRNPGSNGHAACLDFMVAELNQSAVSVVKQPFRFINPKTSESMTLNNVIAHFGPDEHHVLLCAHWDTRPWADLDSNPENHNKPILGANDGASGVAVLLQLARIFKENPPPVGVDLVFFNGEDSGLQGDDQTWCQGSRAFASKLPKAKYPEYAILLDFVGDRDLHFPVEVHSKTYAPDVVDRVWRKAASLNLSAFDFATGPAILDDHIELLRVGIPAIDIIDFEYPHYHTMQDTPDKCSAESLGIVGKLLLHLIYE